MNNNAPQYFTQDSYQRLTEELDRLKTVEMQSIKERIAEALSFGDLAENSEYDEARNDQSKLVARIQELEAMVENAKIIDESELQVGVVYVGSTVTVYDYDMDEECEYQIVSTNDSDSVSGKIADKSPIGQALIGSKAGDDVTVKAPGGDYKLNVRSVERKK